MVRAFSPLLVALAVLLTGCSDLRPIEPVPGQSWALAKKQAYVGPPRLHKVMRGDTASKVAERYGVTLQELASANNLRKPYVIQLGSNLTIPQRGARPAPTAEPARAKRPAIRQLPTPVSPMAPEEAPSEIQVATLAPPGATPPAPVPVPAAAAEPEQVAALPVTAPGAMARAAAMKPPALSGDGFLWPASGTVISRFGKKQDGSQNDGINL
uniref:LysM peptidoglycan-binding domain-containing protein n=1 Tax=Geminicoccus flavidas TaxID=2506407 RepID=UPI00135C8A59